MKEVITVRLPNGLEISMYAKQVGNSMFKKDKVPAESEEALWARFVEALNTTDWKAFASFYQSTMAPLVFGS